LIYVSPSVHVNSAALQVLCANKHDLTDTGMKLILITMFPNLWSR